MAKKGTKKGNKKGSKKGSQASSTPTPTPLDTRHDSCLMTSILQSELVCKWLYIILGGRKDTPLNDEDRFFTFKGIGASAIAAYETVPTFRMKVDPMSWAPSLIEKLVVQMLVLSLNFQIDNLLFSNRVLNSHESELRRGIAALSIAFERESEKMLEQIKEMVQRRYAYADEVRKAHEKYGAGPLSDAMLCTFPDELETLERPVVRKARDVLQGYLEELYKFRNDGFPVVGTIELEAIVTINLYAESLRVEMCRCA